MPAKAGIQGRKDSIHRWFHHWIPAFAGMTARGAGDARRSAATSHDIVDADAPIRHGS